MKILIIGGTGTISTAISKLLIGQGHELYLLNRNNRGSALPSDRKSRRVGKECRSRWSPYH